MASESHRSMSEWWLDDSALPNRYIWARLERRADGSATVFDCDGKSHAFPSYAAAVNWLLEDEYSRLDTLKEFGDVPIDIEPPIGNWFPPSSG